MNSLLKSILVLLPLLAGPTAWADGTEWHARTGLPQLTQVDGQATNWRYLTLGVETPWLEIEARLTTCEAADADAATSARAASRSQLTACSALRRSTSQDLMTQQVKATASLPVVLPAGPDIQLTSRTRALPRGRAPGFDLASSIELEMTQDVGPLQLSFGSSMPVGGAHSVDPWRSSFGAVQWKPARGHVLELSFDFAREIGGAERDRQLTLRYAVHQGAHARWRWYTTRYMDDAADRWESGLGLDWAF